MDKVLLIDGNSIMYRAYYGSAYSSVGILRNSKGTPVNAILILNKMIDKALKTYNPTHILIAFDAGPKTFRHEKLKGYKAGRKKTPEELLVQIPLIKEMVNHMNIVHYEKELIEADDIIGGLAIKFSSEGKKVLVLSSDKDLLQLVNENTSIILPQNGSKPNKIINVQNFYELNEHNPEQVPDFKGLVGDASDNLPGVKGLGPKNANKLLKEYSNLENIYSNIENIFGSLKEKLESSKKIAFLCKNLATLKLDVQIPYSYEELKKREINYEKMLMFLEEQEINSLVKKYNAEFMNKNTKKDPLNKSKQIFDKLIF